MGSPGEPDGSGGRDDRPGCGLGCACAVGNEFDERQARRDLETFRRNGADRTTGWLIEGLGGGAGSGVDGASVLDIGAGIGAVHLALLAAGAATALDVDGSPAYVSVAAAEARRAGVDDRVRHETGDFVELAPAIEPADLVALDRVVCCYPDASTLVGLAAERARRRIGLVYPRDTWWIRAGGRVFNVVGRLTRARLRIWIHRTAEIDAIVRAAGFVPRLERATRIWQVVVYERVAAAPVSASR